MEQPLKPFDQLTPEELKDYAWIGYSLHLAQQVPASVQSEAPLQDSGGYWDSPPPTIPKRWKKWCNPYN